MLLVGHSGWIFAMLRAVCDCSSAPEAAEWFETGEIRSLVLTWHTVDTDLVRKAALD